MNTLTKPQVQRAVDLSRRTGAPLMGCLLNLATTPSRLGGVGLEVDDEASPITGLLDVAVVADFALGFAVRRATQQLRRALPTICLALNLTAELPAAGAARVSAAPATVGTNTSLSSATGLIHSSTGTLIGHCSAMFAVPNGPLLEPLPWELPAAESDASPTSAREERSDSEETVRIICEAVEQARQRNKSWLDILLGLVSPVTVNGAQTERVFLDRTLVANRSGYLQGGVLFAVGALSAIVSDSAEPICADMKFVRPARVDLPLGIETSVERRGRRTEFASSRLYQDDALIATGSFVFRCQ
jgi:acyl-coenzyme A thioesterase PaaI-like protein